jgi:hypothetical protein
MLLRCATRLAAGPAGIAAGLLFAAGVATGVALGATAVGAAVIGKRVWEERRGWRAGAEEPPPAAPEAAILAPDS